MCVHTQFYVCMVFSPSITRCRARIANATYEHTNVDIHTHTNVCVWCSPPPSLAAAHASLR